MARKLLQTIVALLIGLLCYVYLRYGETGKAPDFSDNPPAMILSMLAGFLGLNIVQKQSRWLNERVSWQKYLALRFTLGIFLNYLFLAAVLIIVVAMYMVVTQAWGIEAFTTLHQQALLKLAVVLFFLLFIYNVYDFTIYSYNEFAVGQIESVEVERKHMELQFEALKTQLSPHYLFNCLNTISSLVDEDAQSAETFIRRLVQTYQYILSSRKKKLVALHEEIEFVKAYNYLLKVRFGDALKVNLDLPVEVMQTSIPPLTLQILVENAVKHNIISELDPLRVDVMLDYNKSIVVSNDKHDNLDQKGSFKIGLENIRKRYEYFTNEPIRIKDNENFEVILPLIEAA